MIEKIRALSFAKPHAAGGTGNTVRELETDWDAAVLLAITNSETPEIVFTRRARHLNSHAGEVSFPGGKRETVDSHPIDTALRESQEEIGLADSNVQIITTLDPIASKRGLRVIPVLGLIPERCEFKLCHDEAEHVFQVPLEFFVEQAPARHYRLSRNGMRLLIPSWDWEQEEIWGLTAMILVQFLALIGHKRIDRADNSPISDVR